jgi:hypothetical protein
MVESSEKPKRTGGFALLAIAILCFLAAQQVFSSADRTNAIVLDACYKDTQALITNDPVGRLQLYTDCVSASSAGTAGAWVLITAGAVFGLVSLVKFSSNS